MGAFRLLLSGFLAFLLPPLGVLIHTERLGFSFWLNVLLTFLGYAPGIIHAMWVILTRNPGTQIRHAVRRYYEILRPQSPMYGQNVPVQVPSVQPYGRVPVDTGGFLSPPAVTGKTYTD